MIRREQPWGNAYPTDTVEAGPLSSARLILVPIMASTKQKNAVCFGVKLIPIEMIVRDGWLDTEMRAQINKKKVGQYAEEMREGSDFPMPVVYCRVNGEEYWVGDGFHRILAYLRLKKKEIKVELRNGMKFDALLWNIQANREQRGIPYTIGDKTKCIVTLLRSEESKQWSQRRIAIEVGCSTTMVRKVVQKFLIERPEKVSGSDGREWKPYYPERVLSNEVEPCPYCGGTGVHKKQPDLAEETSGVG